MSKVMDLVTVTRACENHHARHSKVIWLDGVFDGLTPLDVRRLQFAKRQGDILVVGVEDAVDTIYALADRLDVVGAIAAVDYATSFGGQAGFPLYEAIYRIDPMLIVAPGDYACEAPVGALWVTKWGRWDVIHGTAPAATVELPGETETTEPPVMPTGVGDLQGDGWRVGHVERIECVQRDATGKPACKLEVVMSEWSGTSLDLWFSAQRPVAWIFNGNRGHWTWSGPLVSAEFDAEWAHGRMRLCIVCDEMPVMTAPTLEAER